MNSLQAITFNMIRLLNTARTCCGIWESKTWRPISGYLLKLWKWTA